MSSLAAMLNDIEEVLEKYEPNNAGARREQATAVLAGSNVPSEWIAGAHMPTQSELFDDPLLQRVYFGLVLESASNASCGKK